MDGSEVMRVGGWAALTATLLMGCDPGPPLPRVERLAVQAVTAGQSAAPWPVVLQGRRLETSARHPLRFELWRRTPARPRVRVALEGVRLDGRRARAQVPAGTPPGRYRLVAFRGVRGRLTRHRLRIRAPRANQGPPVLHRASTGRPAAGEGGRLVVSGANLLSPALITLHGPQRQALRAGGGQSLAPAQMVGRKVQLSFKPRYRRLRIIELRHPRQATPTRVVATLPASLAPGRYYVQVYTATHRGNKPEVTLQVGPRLAPGHRAWSVVAAGLCLLVALGLAVWLGRPWQGRRLRMALLAVTLVACAAPLLLIL
jgi:hypothetical protein